MEEYVAGSFVKYINNDGKCVDPPYGSSDECKQVFAKAQCLVHHSYHASQKKLMLLEIQGSKYNIYDPEMPQITSWMMRAMNYTFAVAIAHR